jgi:hypothetical protein
MILVLLADLDHRQEQPSFVYVSSPTRGPLVVVEWFPIPILQGTAYKFLG